jgi:selenide,water dikinase
VIDIVLIGGGHSHIEVLRRFAMAPMPGVRVTLVSRDVDTPYSGMLPGLIAGHYTADDAHIDLHRLSRMTGARVRVDEVIGLDRANHRVLCARRPPIAYDVVSINVGSTPNTSVPGAAAHAIPVKPIDRFLERWEALRSRLALAAPRRRIAIVGGGAGGVELLLAVRHQLPHHEFHLFTASAELLPTHNARVRRAFERTLAKLDVSVHLSSPIVKVTAGCLHTQGREHPVDEILWTTEARAAAWIHETGLATDAEGFAQVHATLQSTSDPDVFAAGDVASLVGHRLPKSGVYAVREGPVLAENLRRRVRGKPLKPYRPQRRSLSLISTGNKYAVASRGPLAYEGQWVWRWKDRIDRRFMRMYRELDAMGTAGASTAGMQSPGGIRPASPDAAGAMRCCGCGAKVGSDVLARALARVPRLRRDDVVIGLDAPDDGAVVEVPACKALVQSVDFFRALVDDPYVFGKIAANHALGDLFAMGADPQTALAIVGIPYGPEEDVEDTLTQLMAGAVEVLSAAGAALVGGHTTEAAELSLGFTVNGLVDPARILRKAGLRPGDRLILTKPIGTGALFAADMRREARGRWIASAVAGMVHSSRGAAACMLRHGVRACTDITGFGLVGHLHEMAEASQVDVMLDLETVPLLEGAEQTAAAGILSTLHSQNVRLQRVIRGTSDVAGTPRFALLFDPQTAGGLLAGVPPERADACLADLRSGGYTRSAIVGTVMPRSGSRECIVLRS